MTDDTTFKLSVVLAVSIFALGSLFGVALGVGVYKTVYPPNPAYIPLSLPEVVITPPTTCTFERIGDSGIMSLDAVYRYSCPYGTWLGVIQTNGTVIWSKAP